jgi:hypothetical protein
MIGKIWSTQMILSLRRHMTDPEHEQWLSPQILFLQQLGNELANKETRKQMLHICHSSFLSTMPATCRWSRSTASALSSWPRSALSLYPCSPHSLAHFLLPALLLHFLLH